MSYYDILFSGRNVKTVPSIPYDMKFKDDYSTSNCADRSADRSSFKEGWTKFKNRLSQSWDRWIFQTLLFVGVLAILGGVIMLCEIDNRQCKEKRELDMTVNDSTFIEKIPGDPYEPAYDQYIYRCTIDGHEYLKVLSVPNKWHEGVEEKIQFVHSPDCWCTK